MADANSVLVSAGDDVKVWDVERMRIIKQYNYHKSNIKDVAWNHDNTVLASTASNGESILLCEPEIQDNEKPRLTGKLAKGEQQTAICFGTRGKLIYSGGSTGEVNSWDLKSGKLRKHFDGGHKSPITCISVNCPETLVVSTCTNGEMIIWNAESGDACANLRPEQSQAIRGLDHSLQNESSFGTASDDGSIRLWDVEKQTMRHEFVNSHFAPAMDLSFTPLNNLLLASCGLDKRFLMYDIRNKNVVKTYSGDQPWTVICFLKSGLHVAVGSSLGSIYKFDLRMSNDPLDSVSGHSTSVQRLIPQNIPKNVKQRTSVTKSKNSVSSSVRRPPERETKDTAEKYNKQKKESEKNSNAKSRLLKKSSIGTNGSRLQSNTAGNTPKQYGFGNSDLVNGTNQMRPEEPFIQNAPPQINILSDTPAVNKSHSSNRDTLGSYCEGVLSPVAPEYRGSPFTQGDTYPDTKAKQNPKNVTDNGTAYPKSGETGSFINQAHESGKERLKPGRLSKNEDPTKREAWNSAERRGPRGQDGELGRDSLGSYCEGVFSPVARDRPTRDSFPEVFGSRGGSKETTVNGGHDGREKAGTRQSENKSGLPIGSHGSTLKMASVPFLSKSGKMHPPSPLAYNTYDGKGTAQKVSSPSQSDSDSYHDSPPRSSKIEEPQGAALSAGEAQGAAGIDFTVHPIQYQMDFLKNNVRSMLESVMEQHTDNIRDEIRHLHVQVIKMFAEQDEKMQKLAEQSSLNPVLLQENERLRAENDRLRRKY